mmetsp:Transcript_23935/g.37526  ORF Transcript_23935/g.37526 Transcript_23935/m.37526 type:complete len:106 (+) Transcript_23935:981-1298(+)
MGISDSVSGDHYMLYLCLHHAINPSSGGNILFLRTDRLQEAVSLRLYTNLRLGGFNVPSGSIKNIVCSDDQPTYFHRLHINPKRRLSDYSAGTITIFDSVLQQLH